MDRMIYYSTRWWKISLQTTTTYRFNRSHCVLKSANFCTQQLIIISFLMRSTLYMKRYETFAFQCKDACAVCTYCGGFQRLLCPICHGSKRSVHRNEFTVEFVALKCAKCDVFGMIRCPHCWRRVPWGNPRTPAQIISLNFNDRLLTYTSI